MQIAMDSAKHKKAECRWSMSSRCCSTWHLVPSMVLGNEWKQTRSGDAGEGSELGPATAFPDFSMIPIMHPGKGGKFEFQFRLNSYPDLQQ